MSLSTILLPPLVIWVYSLAFAYMGYRAIHACAPAARPAPLALIGALGFFLAGACFQAIWRALGLLLGMKMALLITTAGAALLIAYLWRGRKNAPPFRFRPYEIMSYGGLAALLHLGLFAFWMRGGLEAQDAFATIGSGHGPRYGNIALYILQFDRVPLVGQNYAQSVMGTINGFLGTVAPLYDLNLWLTISVFFLVVLTYELFKLILRSPFFAACATFCLFLSNTSMTLAHRSVVDLGWPLLVSGYYDAITSIGTLIVALLATRLFLQTPPTRRLTLAYSAVLTCFAYSWSMGAVQNIVLFGAGALALLCLNWRAGWLRRWRLLLVAIPFIAALALGSVSGGMLMPKSMEETVPFGGMLAIDKQGQAPISLNIGLPMVQGSYLDWEPVLLPTDSLLRTITQSVIGVGYIFLGMGLAFWHLHRRDPLLKTAMGPLDRQAMLTMLAVLAMGLLLVIPFNVYGSKWAPSRFLLPGYYFGLMLLLTLSYHLLALRKRPWQRYTVLALMVVMVLGPVRSITQCLLNNFKDPALARTHAAAVFEFHTMMK